MNRFDRVIPNDDAPPTREARAGQSGALSGVASSATRETTTPEEYMITALRVQSYAPE
jgi:hypothetical protein